MLLQQITFLSFYLLALSSLCQVSGYRYRPRQEDQLECKVEHPTFVVRAKLINECQQGLCRSIVHYVNDEELVVTQLDRNRSRQSDDACDLPLIQGYGACIINFEGESYLTTVAKKSGGRWTVQLWRRRDHHELNCKEFEP